VIRQNRRRGNAAITVISMTVLLGFGALAVDIGMVQVANAQLQAAVDAGALGGAGYLDRSPLGMVTAREKAVEIANMNVVPGGWELTLEDVQVGKYIAGTFIEVSPAEYETVDPTLVNAIRVDSVVSDLQAIFGNAAFQQSSLSTSAYSLSFRELADGPAGAMDCLLPFAIPDCEFYDWQGGGMETNPSPMEFRMGNANVDNIGWGSPFATPNGSSIEDALDGTGCHDGTMVEIEEELYLNNGQVNSATKYLGDLLNGTGNVAPTNWPIDMIGGMPLRGGDFANPATGKGASDVSQANWGNVLQGPVALIEADNCNQNFQFNGTAEITGFAYAYVYDVKSKGNPKNLYIQLDFVNEYDIGGDADPDAVGNVVGFGPPLLAEL
jgi:hypothetical protein